MNLRLRDLRAGDVARVKAIESAWPLLSHWDEEIYHRIAAGQESARCLLAVSQNSASGEDIVGFLVYRIVGFESELLNIAVAPEWTRKKIGTRLLEDFLDRVSAKGVSTIYLEVRPSNLTAREFYVKEKFIEVGRRKDYYKHPPEDAIVMRRELTHRDPRRF